MNLTTGGTGRAKAAGATWTRAATGGRHRSLGTTLTGFVVLFLAVDGGARLAGFAPYVEGTVRFGFAERLAPWIGLVLLLSTLLYALPRTAVLGAILLTGYLGGAAATQIRAEDPWFLFPIAFAVAAWAGIFLREDRLRDLLPVRRD